MKNINNRSLNQSKISNNLISMSISRTKIYLSKPKTISTNILLNNRKSTEKRQDISRTSIYLNRPKDNYEI